MGHSLSHSPYSNTVHGNLICWASDDKRCILCNTGYFSAGVHQVCWNGIKCIFHNRFSYSSPPLLSEYKTNPNFQECLCVCVILKELELNKNNITTFFNTHKIKRRYGILKATMYCWKVYLWRLFNYKTVPLYQQPCTTV